jgi:hypothetical protein
MWPTEKRRRALLRELADADRVNAGAGHAGRCTPEQGGAGRTGPRRADGRTAMPRQRRSGDTHPARAERRAWAALKAQVHAPLLQWGMRVGIGAEHTDCQAVLSDLERVRPRGTAEPVGLVHDRRARHAGIMERDYLGSTVESPFGADMSDHAPVHALWDAQSGPVHKRVRPSALWVAEDCSSMGWDGEACAHKRQTQRGGRPAAALHGRAAWHRARRRYFGARGATGRPADSHLAERLAQDRTRTLPSVIKGCRKRRRVRTGGAVDAQQQSKRSRRLPVVIGNKALDWTGVQTGLGRRTYTPHAARILHSSGSTPLISRRTPSHTA